MKVQHGLHSFDSDALLGWSRERFLDRFKNIKGIEEVWSKLEPYIIIDNVSKTNSEPTKNTKPKRRKSL